MRLLLVVALLGCKAGYTRVRTVEELPAGTCVAGPDESCTRSARDYSAGGSVIVPRDHEGEIGAQAWFRWPLFHVGLDERRMRKEGRSFHSIAGAIGTQLRLTTFWPHVHRYVDVVVLAGLELGGLVENERVQGRGAGYVGGALDLYAPDVGRLRYTETGVPGVRIGMRHTAFVQGWDSDTTFEVGLIWRWGVPIDLYRHWTWRRSGD